MSLARDAYPQAMSTVSGAEPAGERTPGSSRPDARTPSAPARVLVIEDEPGIRDFLQRGLQAEGFAVAVAADGLRGQQMALEDDCDAVVLDLMLPGRSGLEVLASLSEAKPRLPVMVLTARGEVEDRVTGLDAGAVDYVTKPFSLAELVARLRAQLRVSAQRAATTISAGGLEVNLLTRKVSRDGRPVTLSTTEFELLVYMLRHRNQVLSRGQILKAVWGYEHDPATNVLDVYVGYLRRKLGRPGDPAPITTVRGVGYRLSDAG